MNQRVITIDCRVSMEVVKSIFLQIPIIEITTNGDAETLLEGVAYHLNRCPGCMQELTELPGWKCRLTTALSLTYLSESDKPFPEANRWVDNHIAEKTGCWCYTNKMRIKLSRVRIVRYRGMDEFFERMADLEQKLDLKKSPPPEKPAS